MLLYVPRLCKNMGEKNSHQDFKLQLWRMLLT